jgi:hypothetical protein
MPIPLLLPLAIAGGAGLAQGISGAIPTKYDKANKERLARLQALQARGNLGLVGSERELRERQLLDPVRAAAGQTRSQAEAAMAMAGGSGAALQQLRREQTQAIGGAAQQAASQLAAESQAKEAAQRAEMEQRGAVREERRAQRVSSLMGGIGQAAGAAGALAGTTPEFFRAAGVAGAPIASTAALETELVNAGVPDAARSYILSLDPNKLTRILNDTLNQGPLFDPQLAALLAGV